MFSYPAAPQVMLHFLISSHRWKGWSIVALCCGAITIWSNYCQSLLPILQLLAQNVPFSLCITFQMGFGWTAHFKMSEDFFSEFQIYLRYSTSFEPKLGTKQNCLMFYCTSIHKLLIFYILGISINEIEYLKGHLMYSISIGHYSASFCAAVAFL